MRREEKGERRKERADRAERGERGEREREREGKKEREMRVFHAGVHFQGTARAKTVANNFSREGWSRLARRARASMIIRISVLGDF